MPLNVNAAELIGKNLLKLHHGRKAWPVVIGYLTAVQLERLNAERTRRGFEMMVAKVVFVGAHIYKADPCKMAIRSMT